MGARGSKHADAAAAAAPSSTPLVLDAGEPTQQQQQQEQLLQKLVQQQHQQVMEQQQPSSASSLPGQPAAEQPPPPPAEAAEAAAASTGSSVASMLAAAASAVGLDFAAGNQAAAAAAAAAQQAEEEEEAGPRPVDESPMLMTSLTQRFRGRFSPLSPPSAEALQQEDLMNNCGVKSCIAGAMGGLLGVAFGVFTASLDTQGIDAAPLGETKPTRVVLRETWVLMREKSRSYAKGFAGMGFLYSGTECLIEKHRAKHDAWNATLAGCATGGLMAAPGGPRAMCFGCASFAAFSTAIEAFTGGH